MATDFWHGEAAFHTGMKRALPVTLIKITQQNTSTRLQNYKKEKCTSTTSQFSSMHQAMAARNISFN